jgi:hypothetical protein
MKRKALIGLVIAALAGLVIVMNNSREYTKQQLDAIKERIKSARS